MSELAFRMQQEQHLRVHICASVLCARVSVPPTMPPKFAISHNVMPNDHTSDFDENTLE